MFLSGLLPRPMCSDDDQKLLDLGIGFTNIVERTTRGSASLSRQEIVEGNKKRNFSSIVFVVIDGKKKKLTYEKVILHSQVSILDYNI